ncbi:MAG: CBS domain-containing protein [Spartobacteria bacterium]|nr:CBS domain-containing protein [Spartobacteria bacterium]
MKNIPIDINESSLVVMDLIFKLKIRDVMTRGLISAKRCDSMHHIQQLMKDNSITGVPIVENKRLYGIISIDDIINALEHGYRDDPAEKHMTTNLVVLDEDMPLSFAINYFDKYGFGRYPVLNARQEVVGIITTRNVNISLLMALIKEIHELESRIEPHPTPDNTYMLKEYHVRQYGFDEAGKASNNLKKFLQEHQHPTRLMRRAAVAAYELEMNLVVHSTGGTLTIIVTQEKVEINVVDHGPGITDVEQAMREGFTTANEWIQSLGFGAGMGLPNARRVSDEFDIESSPDGTRVRSVIYLNPQDAPAT